MAAVRELFRKYGTVAVGVHFTVYFTGISVCYAALQSNVDVKGMLQNYGLMPQGSKKDGSDDPMRNEESNWLEKLVSGTGGTLALAFICNKFLFPVRTPITIGLTPLVARHLERIRQAKAVKL